MMPTHSLALERYSEISLTELMLIDFELSLGIPGLLPGKERHDGLYQSTRKDKGSL